jgi:hypothetical protein
MKLKIIVIFFVTLFLFANCDNGCDPGPQFNFVNAIKLEKGNYWVYESINTYLSAPDVLNLNDSTFIKTDSLIRNNRYYRLENQFGLSEWKRDSSGYVINLKGDIEFFAESSTDTLYRDFENRIVGFMGGKTEQVTVPAGNFSTICFYILEKNSVGEGKLEKNHPQFFNDQYQLHSKTWYANNIGVVKSVFYYEGTGFEKNLIRYKVNK